MDSATSTRNGSRETFQILKRFIESYDGRPFDLIVVGGGISGAAAAYDAASRGLSVALVEKQDFGCATSAATSKLIHGGFRYLANLEFGVVRESLSERRTMSNIAPNFVYPLASMITIYGSKLSDNMKAIRAGMTLYHTLSLDKQKTWDKSKRIPRFKMLKPREVLELEPNVRAERLQGGALIYDCLSICPERLTLGFVKSAVQQGAQVSNYAKVEDFLFSTAGRIGGVRVKDLINDRDIEITGSLVINCSGPWTDIVLGLVDKKGGAAHVRRSEGIHVITRKLIGNRMVSSAARRGGHFFLVPWRNHSLIGTTDKEYLGDPDDYRVTRTAIEELLEDVNGGFGREPIRYEDVQFAYGGLRPLVEDQTKGTYESSRKYEIYDNAKEGFEGLITVAGGKYTTSRSLAENVMEVVARKLGRKLPKCTTAKRHLAGCEIEDINAFIDGTKSHNGDLEATTLDWLARHYGTEYERVLDIARADKALAELLDADGEILAQVAYAVRDEMALTLKDVFFRRTGLGTLGDPGDDVVNKVADLAASELGWDGDRKAGEIQQVNQAMQVPA
jgi:glycerol-3-phosphate dehydrogenase